MARRVDREAISAVTRPADPGQTERSRRSIRDGERVRLPAAASIRNCGTVFEANWSLTIAPEESVRVVAGSKIADVKISAVKRNIFPINVSGAGQNNPL